METIALNQARGKEMLCSLSALILKILALSKVQAVLLQATSVVSLTSGNFSDGNTAWMLLSTALVMMMVVLGISLFYSGVCQVNNVLSTVIQTFSTACVVTIMWFTFSYSLCFSLGSPVLWPICSGSVASEMQAIKISISGWGLPCHTSWPWPFANQSS